MVPQEPAVTLVYPYFVVFHHLLYNVKRNRELVVKQLVVSQSYTRMVLDLAHSHMLSGHLEDKRVN